MKDLLGLVSFSAAPLVTLILSIERSIPKASSGSIWSMLVVGLFTLGLLDSAVPLTDHVRLRVVALVASERGILFVVDVAFEAGYFVLSLTTLSPTVLGEPPLLRIFTKSLGSSS